MVFSKKIRLFLHATALFLLLVAFPSCIPRCIKFPAYAQCQVRMKHAHSGTEYRGVPFWKKQNMQYGEKHKGPYKDTPYVTPKNSKKFLGPTKKKVVVKSKKSRPKGKKK